MVEKKLKYIIARNSDRNAEIEKFKSWKEAALNIASWYGIELKELEE